MLLEIKNSKEVFCIGKLAILWGTWTYDNSKDKILSRQKTIHTYHVVLNILFSFLLGLLVSVFIQEAISYTIAFTSFMFLRVFSGSSFHFKSEFLCLGVTPVLMLSTLFVDLPNTYLIYLNLLSIILIILFAPFSYRVNFQRNKTMTFKSISLVIVLFNIFIIKSELLTVVFFIQSLFLIPCKRK